MATMAPPMPGQPGAGGPGGPPDPSGLVSGLSGPGPGATQGPTPEQMIQEYLKNIQGIVAEVDALASQHPEASKELQTAKQALIDSMTPVAGAMSSPNGMQPPTV